MIPNFSDSVSIKKVSGEGDVAIFAVEGLYTGYGLTIGNALRRVLLSSLPGSAVSQVKIKGVDHEFSSLPGMVEDIVEFSINLKKIRLQLLTDESQTVSLKEKGVKEIKAGDIKTTSFVKIVNPNLHLASLSKKTAELDMELVVEKGLGYVPAERRRSGRLPVGTIILDTAFSPVVRVDVDVENMRVGDRTDYNRIKIEVETDGSVSPEGAMRKASEILKNHFEKVLDSPVLSEAQL